MGEEHPLHYPSDAFITAFMLLRVFLFLPRLISEMAGIRDQKTRIVGRMNNVEVEIGCSSAPFLGLVLSIDYYCRWTGALHFVCSFVIVCLPLICCFGEFG